MTKAQRKKIEDIIARADGQIAYQKHAGTPREMLEAPYGYEAGFRNALLGVLALLGGDESTCRNEHWRRILVR